MKKIAICLISISLLFFIAGCKNDTYSEKIDPAYTPVKNTASMAYDAASDRTTITNKEASFQVPGQWTEMEGGYFNQSYGFVNLIAYDGFVTVYDYTNEYSSSGNWSISGQESQLTITTLPGGATTYGFHINSATSTYKFLYTTIPGMPTNNASVIISTVLQTFQFQSPEVTEAQ